MKNPFQKGLEDSLRVEPCVLIIFGATGDLTKRKLVPALYNLSIDGLLPANFNLIGAARREIKDTEFRDSLKKSVEKHSRRKQLDNNIWAEFAEHTHYVQCPFDDDEGYKRLHAKLEDLDKENGVKLNRIFYFATGPEFFSIISRKLKTANLLDIDADNSGYVREARVIVEKPFGHDLDSARKVNAELLDCMNENQIYRIDHYLGKETVQNLLVFRFANGIFEPIWNHKYISHVEISVCESIGVGSRAGYFDKAGILRDIVQNHVLQLLCLVALEPPVAFEADSVRDEKVKVLRSVNRIKAEQVPNSAVRARYISGPVNGEVVKGYLEETGVDSYSTTETYVALELGIDNWRWANVPFFLRAGKRLAKRITEVSIHFKNVPHKLFASEDLRSLQPNILSFQIQPDEGISLKISSKPPGPKVRVQPVNMDFSYGESFGISAPEAYERLLLDAMRGDATLFARNDEIEQAWDIVNPYLKAWKDFDIADCPIHGYESGTWGPKAADDLLLKSINRGWRRL